MCHFSESQFGMTIGCACHIAGAIRRLCDDVLEFSYGVKQEIYLSPSQQDDKYTPVQFKRFLPVGIAARPPGLAGLLCADEQVARAYWQDPNGLGQAAPHLQLQVRLRCLRRLFVGTLWASNARLLFVDDSIHHICRSLK